MIEEGESEAVIAHFCLQKLHLLPSQFLTLPRKERAFIIASIRYRTEREAEEQRRLKAQARRKRG